MLRVIYLMLKNIFSRYQNSFLYSISPLKKNIELKILNLENKCFEVVLVDKLIIGINFNQLLELLFRSNLLNNGDFFSLKEFEHKFSFSFNKHNPLPPSNKMTVIRYPVISALKHYFYFNQYPNSFTICH